jgi:glycosyltransferase involved in cell wall biosynthesis
MIRICTTLAQARYEVLLVGRERKKALPVQQQLFNQKRLPCFAQKGKWFYIEYNIRLFFYLLFQKVDVLYAVDLDTILPCFWVAKWRKKVIVYDAHEYFTETPELVNRKLVQSIWKWIERSTVPKIHYCITVGDGLAQLFQQQYQTHFVVLRNMPFRGAQVHVAKHTPPLLLYQGALNEGRGLEQMIAAMPYLPQTQLWLAGEGDLSAQLRAQVADLQLQTQVKFLGYLTPDALKALTPKATIGLNLLENKGLSYYYSLANKAFDYVQAGVPCINMDFPEYRYLNEVYEVALLIPDLALSTIVDAVKKLLDHPVYYKILVENCHQAAQVWNWESEQVQLTSLFNLIIDKNFLR